VTPIGCESNSLNSRICSRGTFGCNKEHKDSIEEQILSNLSNLDTHLKYARSTIDDLIYERISKENALTCIKDFLGLLQYYEEELVSQVNELNGTKDE
jgi:hypothetical protein